MTPSPSGFSADWLRLREPLDAAARSPDLASRFVSAVSARPAMREARPLRIVDLAAGTGANFRVLAPLIGGDQDWRLVDHDQSLLEAQASAIGRWASAAGWHCQHSEAGVTVHVDGARWQVRAQALNLQQSLDRLDLHGVDGITTTAFLDLVSAEWMERLSSLLVRAGLPLLATLTVDGRRAWQPALPVDMQLHQAFQNHQSGDKGFGPALGPLAADLLARCLAARGCETMIARSDWRIGAGHPGLLRQLVDESAGVAGETSPSAVALFAEWSAQRHAQIDGGLLTLSVGHLDLLALQGAR